jgi:hypothetical protein
VREIMGLLYVINSRRLLNTVASCQRNPTKVTSSGSPDQHRDERCLFCAHRSRRA